jgi:uncharacterized protein YraI
MRSFWLRLSLLALILIVVTALNLTGQAQAEELIQIPTVDIATVTSTPPTGPMIRVSANADTDQINVRNGPGTNYDKVGILLVGQTAVAKGRSAGGQWILIDYPGVIGGEAWVYSSLVDLSPGTLEIIEPPSTPTPLVTATIDPTLAARYVVTSAATRLPTYTPPPPLIIPTFQETSVQTGPGGIPVGLIIIGLAAVGIFLGVFTLAQGR